jgi:hypothetical protein
MSKTLIAWGALLTLATSPLAAQGVPGPEQFNLRFEYRQWRPKLTSELRYATAGEGTLIDPQADLGLSDENTFELRASLRLAPGHRLRASYTPLDYKAERRITRSFFFGATRYEAQALVQTDVQARYLLGGYEWDIVRRPSGLLGLTVQGGWFDGDVTLTAPESGRRELQSVGKPVGALGLTGRLYLGRTSLQAELAGLSVGARGRLVEAEASARLHVSDRLAVQVGYRLVDVRGEDGTDLVQVRLRGLLFGAELSL